MSEPSILPYTPLSGLKSLRRRASSIVPKSPACQISSQFSKWVKTFSSRKWWVSEIRPIRNMLFIFPNIGIKVTAFLEDLLIILGAGVLFQGFETVPGEEIGT